MVHYANYLSGFKYEIIYRNTKQHANADYLSRFPLKEATDENTIDKDAVFLMNQLQTLPITQKEIRREIIKDAECAKLYNALQTGDSLPFSGHNTDFSLENGCIFYGIRVVIPGSLQKRILEELHTAHIGMTRMKALARSYVWWKGIDNDIEEMCRQCTSCAKIQNNPKKAPLHPWEYPKEPWQRVHIDYAGPFMETNFLIVVDAYSKWVEVIPTKNTSSVKTIEILREIFARFGLPHTVVTDNGVQFKSYEFECFLKANGINHKCSAPYHPSTNGQAERFVQTVKQGLKSMQNEEGNLNAKLCQLLMQYRKVPNSTTGVSPAELMLKRPMRTKLDLLKRSITVEMNQRNEKSRGTFCRELQVGEQVQARFYNNKCLKWKFGIVTAKRGNYHYEIIIDGQKHTRHIDQLRRVSFNASNDIIHYDEIINNNNNPDNTKSVFDHNNGNNSNQCNNNVQDILDKTEPTHDSNTTDIPQSPHNQPEENLSEVPDRGSEPLIRRSARTRKQPERLTYKSF